MKKIALLLAVLLTFSVLLTACATQENTSTETTATEAPVDVPNEEPVEEPIEEPTEEVETSTGYTVVDLTGREIYLEAIPERIVALTASDAEIVYALGAGDKVVGRGEYCDYPAEIFEVPAVNSGSDTNIEQIIELAPDVVILGQMAQTVEQVEQLENAGIAVYSSGNAGTIEEAYSLILGVGALLSLDDEANAIVDSMKATFDEIAANKVDGGTIYFEVSPLEWGLWTAGTGTFMDEVATIIGLTNVFGDVEGWAAISEEEVLDRNPDYILTINMYWGEGPTPEEEIYGRAGWENISAVVNQKVINLPNNELSRPAPRLAEGAQILYDFVTGE